MPNRTPDRRVSTCTIERGLYVLRYTASPSDPGPAAAVRIQRGSMDIVGAPGQEDAMLRRPGQALVVVAHTKAVFDLEVTAGRRGGVDASFSLDLVASGADEGRGDHTRSEGIDARHADPRQPDSLPDILVGAHVSRRGDLTARLDEWIAGPGMVLPIEGLSIAVDHRDLSIDLRVQTERTLGQWSDWHRNGEFAGTRQRAEALTALALSLRGDLADAIMLSVDIMHLGSGVQTREGRDIAFIGVDPIVGFRLRLKSVATPLSNSAESRGGLRVFRAHHRQS